MKLLRPGLAILERDTHFSQWIQDRGGLVDPGLVSFLKPYIRPGQVVLDVGANIGTYTGAFCRLVGPSGKVYAFEPNPEAFECLRINCPEAVCVPVGASDKPGVFSVDATDNNVGAAYLKSDPAGQAVCLPIDAFGLSPAFIKVDIEGMEYPALLGMEQTMKATRPMLLVEYHVGAQARNGHTVAELRSKLYDFGYKELWFSSDVLGPQCDVLLAPI